MRGNNNDLFSLQQIDTGEESENIGSGYRDYRISQLIEQAQLMSSMIF